MSKDFEQAYKELAQIEVPDLWDRIEAGLKEKSTPEKVVQIEKIQEVKAEEKKEEGNKAEEKKSSPKSVLVFLKRYSAVAAALICVAILVPAITFVGRFGIGGSKSESAATTEFAQETESFAADGMTEEACMEEMAETEMASAEIVQNEETVFEEAAAEENAEEFSEACDEAAEDMTESDEPKEKAEAEDAKSAKEESAVSGRAEEGAGGERTLEEASFYNVQVRVIEGEKMQKIFEGTEAEEDGCIYIAEVEKDPAKILTEGEEIAIFIPTTSSLALMENETFELDLSSFYEEEECYFRITKFHKQLKQ